MSILKENTVQSKRARRGQHSNDTPQHLRQLQQQKSGVQERVMELHQSAEILSKAASGKQRGAASDNAYNYPITTVTEFYLC